MKTTNEAITIMKTLELNVKNIKAINKAISKRQNSWAYVYDDGFIRYTYNVKKDRVFEHREKYFGIYYCSSSEIGMDKKELRLWFEKYEYLINQ
jgi:hypothetical protein